jgi:hypothetical protein
MGSRPLTLSGSTLRERVTSLSAAVLAVLSSLFLSDDARTQNRPTPTPTEARSSIGKVVSAIGTVSIEHHDAVVVQANLSANAAQTKAGDPVYKGIQPDLPTCM